jgi:C1A family cysteine protease
LHSIKDNISKGIPHMFGFTVYNSIGQSSTTGKIPYPCEGEKVEGGHAIMAVGYDDKMSIKNEMCNKENKGALLIRNSWGEGWGEKVYGYLPYDFVLEGLAEDWWTLIEQGWSIQGNLENEYNYNNCLSVCATWNLETFRYEFTKQ